MERKLNATDLFGPNSAITLIPCSESFWSVLFALFLLEQTQRSPLDFAIPVYWRKVNARAAPWYERRRIEPYFAPGHLRLSDLTVEPTTTQTLAFLERVNDGFSLPAFGIRPDVLVLGKEERPCLTFIECKTSTGLQQNQMENYPLVIAELERKGRRCQLLLLASVGMSKELDGQVLRLQERLGTDFGVLLWEEVVSEMIQSKFENNRLDTQQWAKYVEVLSEEAQAH